jgi:hypothetical protein
MVSKGNVVDLLELVDVILRKKYLQDVPEDDQRRK